MKDIFRKAVRKVIQINKIDQIAQAVQSLSIFNQVEHRLEWLTHDIDENNEVFVQPDINEFFNFEDEGDNMSDSFQTDSNLSQSLSI